MSTPVYRVSRSLRNQGLGQPVPNPHPTQYTFLVYPSCPPDTQLHVSGGTRWDYGLGGRQYEAQSVDLGDPATVSISWTTGARMYRAYMLALGEPGEWFFPTDGVEYATAAEAEDALEAIPRSQAAWSEGIPLARVILRENGSGGVDAIDVVNRGRSYVF